MCRTQSTLVIIIERELVKAVMIHIIAHYGKELTEMMGGKSVETSLVSKREMPSFLPLRNKAIFGANVKTGRIV